MTYYAPPEGSYEDSHGYGLMSGALNLASSRGRNDPSREASQRAGSRQTSQGKGRPAARQPRSGIALRRRQERRLRLRLRRRQCSAYSASTSVAYFRGTTVHRTLRVGVSSPVSELQSCASTAKRLICSTRDTSAFTASTERWSSAPSAGWARSGLVILPRMPRASQRAGRVAP